MGPFRLFINICSTIPDGPSGLAGYPSLLAALFFALLAAKFFTFRFFELNMQEHRNINVRPLLGYILMRWAGSKLTGYLSTQQLKGNLPNPWSQASVMIMNAQSVAIGVSLDHG